MSNKSSHKTLQVSFTVLLLLSILSAVYYCTFLFDPNNIGNIYLYFCLLFIEIYVMFQTIGAWWTMLYSGYDPRDHLYYDHKKKLVNDDTIEGGVDVLITVYGEDINIIRETVTAARDMDVDHETYILDDGRSADVEKLAKELGVNYITRENNLHKKAGNINNALKYVHSKYFVIFDADHQPKKNYLIETLPFFWEDNVAFIQTPQVLKNRTNIISSGTSDAQKLFYEIVCSGKNKFNSVFWVGTNAIFRRSAIDQVGGIYLHTSEDIYTAYILHQRGWKSIYIPNKLTEGLAPDNVETYFKQQIRWAAGGIEIFLRSNPLTKNLSLDQKIQYLLTTSFYFNGLVIFLMLSIPIIFLCFGIYPLSGSVSPLQWALCYIPYFLLQFILVIIIIGRFSWEAYVLSINSFWAYMKALILVLFKREIKWRVTGAQGTSENKLAYLIPHIIFVTVIFCAIPISLINVKEVGTTFFSIFWCLLNACTILTFIVLNLKDKYK